MSEIHVEADIPSFSKLRLSVPWSILEILQQLTAVDEMKMMAISNRDLSVDIMASKLEEDMLQLDITGNGASVFEAIQDWWSFSIKSILSPVYLIPKEDQAKSNKAVSVLPLDGSQTSAASSCTLERKDTIMEDCSQSGSVMADTSQEHAQPILDVPLGAKVLLSTDGHTDILTYDMGVVLEIPEAEQDSFSHPEWPQEVSVSADDSPARIAKASIDPTEKVVLSADGEQKVLTSRLDYGCYMCSKTVSKQSALQRHFLRCHSETPFQPENVIHCPRKVGHVCAICSLTWRSKYALQRHMIQVHELEHPEQSHSSMRLPDKSKKPRLKPSSDNTPCLICQKTFIHPSSLKKHINLYHNGHEKYDEAMRAMQEAWLDQLKGRQSQVSLPCPLCSTEQAGPKLIKHLRFVHSDAPDINTVIQDTTTALKIKRYNLKCEKRRQIHQCPKCLKHLQKASMYKHACLEIRDEKGRKIFKRTCPECKKEFSITSYYSHIRRVHHVTIKREMEWHKCQVCDKKFSALYKLKKHQLVHTDERPHRCDQCNNSFKDMYGVRQHIKYVHQREFRIKCDTCKKGFRKNLELQRHRCIPPREDSPSSPGRDLTSLPPADLAQSEKIATNEKNSKDPALSHNLGGKNQEFSQSPTLHNVDDGHVVSPEISNTSPVLTDKLLAGMVMVRNKSKEGNISWVPLNPAHVPSMLAANFCRPLEVVLCEPPVEKFDPLAITSLKMRTKGLLEMASDKKGLSITPVKEFPSETKVPKVTKPRYKVKESEKGKPRTVVKTIKGKAVVEMHDPAPKEKSVKATAALPNQLLTSSANEQCEDPKESEISTRRSSRKKVPTKRLYDEDLISK